MKTRTRGFSLIELLIAVTIIAILTAVGMANFRTASQKARDSRRESELEQIRSALELYRSDSPTGYPSTLPVCGDELVIGSNVYIKKMPCDPSDPDSAGYSYIITRSSGSNNFEYELGAEFETDGNGECDALSEQVDSDGKGYCVVNP